MRGSTYGIASTNGGFENVRGCTDGRFEEIGDCTDHGDKEVGGCNDVNIDEVMGSRLIYIPPSRDVNQPQTGSS